MYGTQVKIQENQTSDNINTTPEKEIVWRNHDCRQTGVQEYDPDFLYYVNFFIYRTDNNTSDCFVDVWSQRDILNG